MFTSLERANDTLRAQLTERDRLLGQAEDAVIDNLKDEKQQLIAEFAKRTSELDSL
jgi:hypothetical protein